MPTRDRAPSGAPCWVGLTTSDVEGARAFYGTVLGWTSSDPDPAFGGYFMFSHDGVPVAGGSAPMAPGVPDHWEVYLASDDADATVARATEHGGQVIAPVMQVGDLGKMAILGATDGSVIGVWEPISFPGFTRFAEPGTPQWCELHSNDYAAGLDFTSAVFGWTTQTMSDTPEFRYTVAVVGEENIAGVMDATTYLPAGVPSQWVVYFGVEDADAALAAITGLGGSVIRPAEDTPYGRIAMVADPTGTQFRIMQSP